MGVIVCLFALFLLITIPFVSSPSFNFHNFNPSTSSSIISQGRTSYCDGIPIFILLEGSLIPERITLGGSLGLTSDDKCQSTSNNHSVAVEINTFNNFYNLQGDHVCTNINSMQSVVDMTWISSIPAGKRTVSFNTTLEIPNVVFDGLKNNSTVTVLQNPTHNWKEYLHEWVTFGFTVAKRLTFGLQSVYLGSFTPFLEDHMQYSIRLPWYHAIGNYVSGLSYPFPFSSNSRCRKSYCNDITDSWGLSLNPGLKDIDPGLTTPNPKQEHVGRKNMFQVVVGLVSGCCVLIVVYLLTWFAFCRKRKVTEDKTYCSVELNDDLERITGPKKFRYSKLARCTKHFAEEEKLGEGGFGVVYKGYLPELNSYVAVKRISRESKQGIKEYASEVRTISRIRHRHLVQLIGWCHNKRELLLVYEFMPNESLDTHLFEGKSHLPWPIRYKIVQGLASALHYLHEEWEQCVLHRDIKSSNIMLDSDFNAKLGDFGLARLVDHEKGSHTTVPAGTPGYIAPEFHNTCRASKETDIYSFGVVILEIVCGRLPILLKAEPHQVNIVEWVRRLYGTGNLREAVDPKLSSEFNEEEMERLLILGLRCAHPDNNCRPSIGQVIYVLFSEAPLLDLPSMPMPTGCFAAQHPPTASSSTPCDTNCSENSDNDDSDSDLCDIV